MAFKGIDIRQTSDRLVFRALLQDSVGALLATGTTTVKLYELQTDGTLKSYDFTGNTFKTTALTTETLAMTHRTGNNATTNTGVWTAILATLTGFTAGNIYFAMVNNTGASPKDQQREFQFGSVEGDLAISTAGNLDTNVAEVSDDAAAADTLELVVEAMGADNRPLLSSDAPLISVTPLIPNAIDLANTAIFRLGLQLVDAIGDLPTTAEITPGTIDISRKPIGGNWSTVLSGVACSEAAGLIYYDEVFDTTTLYAEGDSIRIKFKSQKVTVGGVDHEITDTTGRIFYTSIRQTMRGTDSANTTTPPTVAAIRSEIDTNSTQLSAIAADTNELQTDDVPTLVAGVQSDTNDLQVQIGTAGAGLTAIPAVASVTGAVGSVTGNVGGNVVGSVASVTVVNDKTGYALSTAGILAIWNQLTSALTTASTVGKKLADWVVGNVLQINSSATAAAQLARSAATIVNGAAIAGTLSTTEMTTDLTEATDDHFKGRVIIWTSGVLINQATDITAYTGSSKKLTYTATTEAPSAADTFVIV